MLACIIVRLSTIVRAAFLWVLPDADLRIHLFMVTSCTPARSRSNPSVQAKGVVSFEHAAGLLQVVLSVSEVASGFEMYNVQQMLVCQALFRLGQARSAFGAYSAVTELLIALTSCEIASLRFGCSTKLLTVCHSGMDWCTLRSEPSSKCSCTKGLVKQLITWSLHSNVKVTVGIQISSRIQIQIVH